MESIRGVPAHPLFVHAPIVLIPLFTIAAIAALHSRWREHLRWPLAVSSVVVFLSVFLATQSGEELQRLLQSGNEINKHADLAETTRLIAFILTVVCVAHGAYARWLDRNDRPRWIGGLLAGLTAGLGVMATVWMIRTGHEGARIHWKGTVKN
jgi:uncharacterized membrane protein